MGNHATGCVSQVKGCKRNSFHQEDMRSSNVQLKKRRKKDRAYNKILAKQESEDRNAMKSCLSMMNNKKVLL